MSTDDKDELASLIRRLRPENSRAAVNLFTKLARTTDCLVLVQPDGNTYTSAIVLIRAEHPRLCRQSCIHEECRPGLGLLKDSGTARPSIFNDDEEFAYLTTHDEMLSENAL